MSGLFWALGASIVVSLISLVGIFSLLLKENLLNKILIFLIAFSAGALIGGAFLHLLPEAVESQEAHSIFLNTIYGFIAFFIMEKYLYWRHCHNGVCQIHTFTYLNLFGDAVHNFIDGMIIGASFLVSVHFGIVTSIMVILHEIPQEIGDFGVLVYGGFGKIKALYFNFLSALTCIVGTIAGYFVSEKISGFMPFLMAFTAGGFIYIAACDLVPELHKQPSLKKSLASMVAFIFGILFLIIASKTHAH